MLRRCRVTHESARNVATGAPSRTTSHSSRGRSRITAIGELRDTERGEPGSLSRTMLIMLRQIVAVEL
jgi:hypothetical protein